MSGLYPSFHILCFCSEVGKAGVEANIERLFLEVLLLLARWLALTDGALETGNADPDFYNSLTFYVKH